MQKLIKMKSKTGTVLLALVIMSSFGCKELEKLTQFTMSFNSKITIPSTSIVDLPVSVRTPAIPTNSEALFSQNETNAASIDEIQLQSMTLTIDNPANSTFNFFKSVEVFMDADGLSEVSLGSKTDVVDGLISLDLTTTGANIKEYILRNEFTIRVQTTTDETINSDHEININTVFFVDAKILGQ
ncbi:MAG: hypothetical protein ACI91R_000846 [Vicingaceae bacterium]|jgi:hypothetical protein